jgi:hypothetical protein
MLKLKAELDRQGIICEAADNAMASAMAHNFTLNYGGVTPATAVFEILPRRVQGHHGRSWRLAD